MTLNRNRNRFDHISERWGEKLNKGHAPSWRSPSSPWSTVSLPTSGRVPLNGGGCAFSLQLLQLYKNDNTPKVPPMRCSTVPALAPRPSLGLHASSQFGLNSYCPHNGGACEASSLVLFLIAFFVYFPAHFQPSEDLSFQRQIRIRASVDDENDVGVRASPPRIDSAACIPESGSIGGFMLRNQVSLF